MTTTPAAPEPTEIHPDQGTLFGITVTRTVIATDCARPDGGPLTDADFDNLAQLARTIVTERTTTSCR
ncbi:hypothetical protein ACIO3O_37705 [Streptomyces sp. NPDC087440]|uniref:hypothetical protein n=1 Tax=Streptomyces sp. NPDC087440 TaxID=3365790 RepID=UPI003812C6FC